MLNELKDEILDKLVGESKEIIIEKDGTVRFLFYDVKKKEKFDAEYWYKILTSEHRQLKPAFKIPTEDVRETAILDKVGDVEGYKFKDSDKEFLNTLSKERLISAIINRDNIIENIKTNVGKHIDTYASLLSGLSIETDDNTTRKELVQMRENIRNYNFDAWKGIRK
nr:MAG TPA: hypothetical protein [Caudoviricetes sp.]